MLFLGGKKENNLNLFSLIVKNIEMFAFECMNEMCTHH